MLERPRWEDQLAASLIGELQASVSQELDGISENTSVCSLACIFTYMSHVCSCTHMKTKPLHRFNRKFNLIVVCNIQTLSQILQLFHAIHDYESCLPAFFFSSCSRPTFFRILPF